MLINSPALFEKEINLKNMTMKIYNNRQEAIYDMHERGYIYDFRIAGNELFWIQLKIYLQPRAFRFMESHWFPPCSAMQTGSVVVGISASHRNAKGILVISTPALDSCGQSLFRQKVTEMQRQFI